MTNNRIAVGSVVEGISGAGYVRTDADGLVLDPGDYPSITTSDIAAGAVTAAKIASDSITTVKILNDAVTNAKIADGAVARLQMASSYIPAVIEDEIDTSATAYTPGTINPTPQNALSTFCAWGYPIGSPGTIGSPFLFNKVQVPLYPFDAGDLPTQVRVILRTGGQNGTLILDETVSVSPTVNTRLNVTVTSDTVIGVEDQLLYIQFVADGKTGFYSASMSTLPDEAAVYGVDQTQISALSPGSWYDAGSTAGWAELWLEQTGTQFTNEGRQKVAAAVSSGIPAVIASASTPIIGGDLGLSQWRHKIARINAGVSGAQAVIAMVGDSITSSDYSGPSAMRAWTSAMFGNGGAGYCSASAAAFVVVPSNITRTRSGTWTDVAFSGSAPYGIGLDGTYASTTDTGATLTINPTGDVDTYKIYWYRQSGGGSFAWNIGGGPTSVSTAGAESVQVTTITGAADANLAITIPSAGSGVTILGVECLTTDIGVRVNKLGCAGISTLGVMQMAKATYIESFTAMAPDLVILNLGVNDRSYDAAPSDYKNRLQQIIDRFRLAVPRVSILIIGPGDNGQTGKVYTSEEYRLAAWQTAVSNGCAYSDLGHLFGPYATPDGSTLLSAGIYEDTVHPSSEGGQMISDLYRQVLVSR